jgi:hypothetical protein
VGGDLFPPFDPAQAAQGFAQDLLLERELLLVVKVLVVAAAAAGEVGAACFDAIAGGFFQVTGQGADKLARLLQRKNVDDFAGQHERNEDRLAVVSTRTVKESTSALLGGRGAPDRHVEEAQAGQVVALEEFLLLELFLDHRQLLGLHLAAAGG